MPGSGDNEPFKPQVMFVGPRYKWVGRTLKPALVGRTLAWLPIMVERVVASILLRCPLLVNCLWQGGWRGDLFLV
jgi:hypothetical protein